MADKDLAKLLMLNEIEIFRANEADLEEFENSRGSTISASAARIRNLLDESTKTFKKSRLTKLREEIEESKLAQKAKGLLDSIEDRRKTLEGLLQQFPGLEESLTFQNRDLNTLTDEDVDLALEQLEELGALEEYLSSNKDKNES